MDMDTASLKRFIELEQQITQLLKTMRNTKLNNHPVYAALQALEEELGEARRARFDEIDSNYKGY